MKYATSLCFRLACLAALALLAIPALLAGYHGDGTPLAVLGMAAATFSIDTPERDGSIVSLPVAAATTIYAGTLVAVNSSGFAVPAADTAGLRVVGRSEEDVVNAGSAGDVSVLVKRGIFRFANSATAAVDPDDVGKIALVEDNQTVAETATNAVKAGRIIAVETSGVWVDTREAANVAVADTITGAADLAALKTALATLLRNAGFII